MVGSRVPGSMNRTHMTSTTSTAYFSVDDVVAVANAAVARLLLSHVVTGSSARALRESNANKGNSNKYLSTQLIMMHGYMH